MNHKTDSRDVLYSTSLFSESEKAGMNQIFLKDNETIEDLQLNGLMLIQKKDGFRFGMDSVLLAHFSRIGPNALVADFGTGSGVLPLLLIGRNKGQTFLCFEIQDQIAEMAERTVCMNHLENRIQIIHGDAGKAYEQIDSCSVDAVICNPPYGIPGTVISSPVSSRAIARNQGTDTMESFLLSAFRILKGHGKFITIYPAAQMLYLMKLMQKAHLEPKCFQLIYPYADKPANLVLIEAVKDARPTLHPMEPLIIYTDEGTLTNRLKSAYNISE